MPAPTTITYGGRQYRLRADGYYGDWFRMLHRERYRAEVGPIPEGYHVHHLDHDRGNNDVSNLQAMSPAEHWQQHHAERGPDWHASGGRALWANRVMEQGTCKRCGAPFTSRATYRLYCGSKCADAAARPRAERLCCVCGGPFTCQERYPTRTCSPPCRATYAYQQRARPGL